MTLLTTVSTSVAPAAITKVTRLFNGTLYDVLNELFQNARRAGATSITLSTERQGAAVRLSVIDDGIGIDEPEALVTLGHSAWDVEIVRREDPAGMGVFSLAGRQVEIRSWSPRHAAGWKLLIEAEDWETSNPVSLASCAIERGTAISFDLPAAWQNELGFAVARAALYFPLPVTLDGEALPRKDWLEGAEHIETTLGCRIGVFKTRSQPRPLEGLNFHGILVASLLPRVTECRPAVFWSVRIDIEDAPQLQLVLPARKEMVENAALEELRAAAKAAIYRAIEKSASHRLSFDDWREAADLGVMLPAADQRLYRWQPARAENAVTLVGELVEASAACVMPEFGPEIAQPLDRALRSNSGFSEILAEPEPNFTGYGWYDDLPRLRNCAFIISAAGGEHRYDDLTDYPDLASGRVEAITAEIAMERSGELDGFVKLPMDHFVAYDPCYSYGLEDAAIFLTRDSAADVEKLSELLKAICFDPSGDRDADSWDTQEENFMLEARLLAIGHLHDEDAALIERCKLVVAKHLRWLLPKGKTISILASDDVISVDLKTLPLDPGSPS